MKEKEFLKRVEKLKEFSEWQKEMISKGNRVSHSQTSWAPTILYLTGIKKRKRMQKKN